MSPAAADRGMAWTGVVLSAALAVGLAVWLAPASVQIVGWGTDGPVTLALVPPIGRLWVSVGLALLVGGLVAGAWPAVSGRPLRVLGRRLTPLLLLALWGLPYLPDVPQRLPLLLVLAGPAKWAVAGLAGAGIGWPWLAAAGARLGRLAPGRGLLFSAALGLFLLGGLTTIRTSGPGGDEPHYLIIAHSLIYDGDLKIENNHTQRDYASYFGGDLRPDFMARGADGAIYSVHAPGLPAVIAPAYAVGGYVGAVLMIVFVSALLTVAIYDLARQVTGSGPARLAWVATAATVPLIPLAWMIYPELVAALLVAWGARWIVEPVRDGPWRWARRGAALALLPWLHTKFAVLLLCLGVALAVRLRARVGLMAALAGPVAVSVAAWFGMFQAIYDRLDPMAPYGGGTGAGLALENLPRGVLGLALDQEFGLLIFSPVYALALVGAWRLLRESRHRWFGLWTLVTAGVFLGSVTQAYMWWGGASAPARFLLPLVPLAAPMLAAAVPVVEREDERRSVLTGLWWVAGAWSLFAVVAGWSSIRWSLLLENRDGVSRLVTALQGPAPLDATLSSFIVADWPGSLASAAPWVLTLAIAAGLAWLAVRAAAATGDSAYWAGAVLTLGVLFVGAGVAGSAVGRLEASERAEIERRGRAGVLAALDGDRLVGLSSASIGSLGPEGLLAGLSMTAAPGDRQAFGEASTLLGPFDLPAGRYELRLSRDDASEVMPVSVVYYLRRMRGRLASDPNGVGDPIVLPFDVPVDLEGVWARVPGDGTGVARVEVVPLEVVPRRDRVDRGEGVVTIRRVPGGRGGSMAFLDDALVPATGYFQIRAERTGTVILEVPEGRQPVLAFTNTGAIADEVFVSVGDWVESVRLKPGERVEMRVPAGPGRSVVPVVITRTARIDPERPSGLRCRVRMERRR